MLARHVSDLTGPSSGAFYKLYVQIWYVVIRVLLDTSSLIYSRPIMYGRRGEDPSRKKVQWEAKKEMVERRWKLSEENGC